MDPRSISIRSIDSWLGSAGLGMHGIGDHIGERTLPLRASVLQSGVWTEGRLPRHAGSLTYLGR